MHCFVRLWNCHLAEHRLDCRLRDRCFAGIVAFEQCRPIGFEVDDVATGLVSLEQRYELPARSLGDIGGVSDKGPIVAQILLSLLLGEVCHEPLVLGRKDFPFAAYLVERNHRDVR